MEYKIIKSKSNKNIELYQKYKMFSHDFLFYYAIIVLYLTITKRFSISEIMYLSALHSFFCIFLYFIGNYVVDKINLKYSIILGNIFLIINIIIYILGNNFFIFILANFFSAFGFTLKNISESSILYSSLKKVNNRSDFSLIEGKSNSKFHYYDAISSLVAGFLFVFNNYLPLILCLSNLLISLIISSKFFNIDPIDKNKKYKLKEITSQTKEILISKRLRSLYLFSLFFTGIVCVSTTLYKAILIDIGIKGQYITIIVCIFSIFVGIGAKKLFDIEKVMKNKTLKFLSMGFILSLFFIGITSAFNKLNLLSLSIVILCLSAMGLFQGAYRVALKKYVLSFTTHKIRGIITSTYYIAENIGTSLLSFLIGILLNYYSTATSCILFATLSFIVISIILIYMNGKIGLKPEEYDSKEINNFKI